MTHAAKGAPAMVLPPRGVALAPQVGPRRARRARRARRVAPRPRPVTSGGAIWRPAIHTAPRADYGFGTG